MSVAGPLRKLHPASLPKGSRLRPLPLAHSYTVAPAALPATVFTSYGESRDQSRGFQLETGGSAFCQPLPLGRDHGASKIVSWDRQAPHLCVPGGPSLSMAPA